MDFLKCFFQAPKQSPRNGLAQASQAGRGTARRPARTLHSAEPGEPRRGTRGAERTPVHAACTTESMLAPGGSPLTRWAAVCGRAGCALGALLLLSLAEGANSSSSSSIAASRSVSPELAFCAPLSPRCFPGRAAAREQGAGRRPARMKAVTDNASEASPASTPRKHLGPTAEEIVAQRREEALARKCEVLSSWRCDPWGFPRAGPCCGRCCASASACALLLLVFALLSWSSARSPVEETSSDAIEAYTRPVPVGSGGSAVGGGRHLGPTLDEVVSLYRNKPSKSSESKGPASAAVSPKTIGKVLGGSGTFDLVAGGPSREQVHALLNLGITQMPATKEEASRLIRERRDLQMGERLGLVALKTEAQAPPPSNQPAPPPPVTSVANQAGPEEHLNMALRGLNMITRR